MVKDTLKILALLLLLTMCEQKEKIQPRPYPRVRTFSVTEITPKGAVFHGEVIYTPSPITDYGFVWSYNPNLNPNDSEVLSLGSLASAGKFEARIERSLKAGYMYYVRAYAKTSNYEVYGDPITFLSLGSDAPVITKLDPPKGIVTDTIRIVGRNFSKISSNIQVRFDTLKSKLVEASDSVLRVIVPPTLSIPSAFVSVSVLGNVTTSSTPFELVAPTLTTVTPGVVAPCDTLHIMGSDFSILPNNLKVTLGGVNCVVLSVSSSSVQALVPSFTPSSSALTLEVICSNIKATYPSPITYQAPSITTMSSPGLITYLDTLEFNGANLPLCGPLAVTIGTLNAATISRTKTMVKVIVPETLTTTNNTIKLDFNNGEFVYQTNFSLAAPVITSISPSTGTFGDVITITGNYFHPTTAGNYVSVGDFQAYVVSAKRTELKAKINTGSVVCSSTNSCNKVNVIIGDRVCATTDFSLNKPQITSISPTTITGYGSVAITGNFFGPGFVNFNNRQVSASFNSSTSITIHMTRDALANDNYYFSSDWIAPMWVSVGNADPSRPTSLYSNTISVPVHYDGPWTLLNAYTGTSHSSPITFSVNNKAYLVGGLNSANTVSAEVWEYDAVTDSWRRLADFPGGARWKGIAFEQNGLGYLGLGQGNSSLYKDMWEFNPATETWTQLTNFPGAARQSAFTFTVAGNTFVGGGDTQNSPAALDFWRFEPATKTWTQKADLPKPFYSGITFNDLHSGYVVEFPELWTYNPIANWWGQRTGPNLPAGGNTFLYQASGLGDWGQGFLFSGVDNIFYKYDYNENNWFNMVSIPTPGYGRTSFTIGQIFYYGLGKNASGSPITDFYKFEVEKYPY